MSELFEKVFKEYLDKYQEELLNERNKLMKVERDLQERERALKESNERVE